MTTLPAIHKGSRTGSASTRSKVSKTTSYKNSKFMTWKERELVKHQKIRDEHPVMSKVDTSVYRNTYKHNLCVNMLKVGFHKSFDELFTLIERRKQERLNAGVNSVLWQEAPLDVQEEKLDQLQIHLTKAESAARNGKWEEVYSCRHTLAQYFLNTGDVWLSDHFFRTALETSLNIRLDGRKREAEGHCNMGLALERNDDIDEATNHMEQFHQLTVGRTWVMETGITYTQSACRHLCRLYMTLAERSADLTSRQSYLHRALDMAKEGEDNLQEARAALRLGRNYEQIKDSETAIQYLKQSLDTAQLIRDDILMGEACEALSRSHQTQGNLPRSIEYLELYAKTSQSSEHSIEFIEACNCLGTIYNSTGDYDKSVEHFTSAYEAANAIMRNDPVSRVQLGVARGNQMLNPFKENMTIPERIMMSRIVGWKDERMNEFGNPLPTTPEIPEPTPEETPDPTEPYREADSSMQEQ